MIGAAGTELRERKMRLTGDWQALVSKISEQRAGFKVMLELARRQLEVAKDEVFPANLDEFQRLVSQRQELMQRLEAMQAEIAGLERELVVRLGVEDFTLKAINGKIPHEQYEEIAQHLAELGDVLYRINRVDEELEAVALGKLKAERTAPDDAFKRQQAVQAYKETMKKQEPHPTE